MPGAGSRGVNATGSQASAGPSGANAPASGATATVAAVPLSPAADPASWSAIINQLDLQGAARQLASNCVLIGRQEGVVRLALDPRTKFVRTALQEEKLAQALSRYFGQTVRLEFSTTPVGGESPAQAEQRASLDELDAARRAFESDPGVQGLRERFGATLLSETVRPVK